MPNPAELEHILPELRAHAVELAVLTLDPKNARKHTPRNMEAIKASLKEFGQHRLIVVQKSSGVVRIGNGLVMAMRELGLKYGAAVHAEDDELKAKARALADNRASDLGEMDTDVLSELLEELVEGEQPVVGWTEAEMAGVLADATNAAAVAAQAAKDVFGDTPDATQDDENTPSPSSSGSDSTGVVKSSIVFDNADQQEQWNRFLKHLRTEFAEGETHAARLAAFIRDHLGD